MAIDKDLKRDIRVETGMRFVKAIPSPPEVKEAARLVLESKLKQKRLQLDAKDKKALINAICDDLLGFGPLEPLLRWWPCREVPFLTQWAVWQRGQFMRSPATLQPA